MGMVHAFSRLRLAPGIVDGRKHNNQQRRAKLGRQAQAARRLLDEGFARPPMSPQHSRPYFLQQQEKHFGNPRGS